MTGTKIIHVIGAIVLIAVFGLGLKAILYQPQAVQSTGAVSLGSSASVVSAELKDGVQEAVLSWGKFNYDPETIVVKKDIPVRIVADVARLTGCFRSFRISDLGVSASFSEEQNAVTFTPTKTGTFAFGCSMGMGAGKLVVQ